MENKLQSVVSFGGESIGLNVCRCEEYGYDLWDVYITSYKGLAQMDQFGNSFSISAHTKEDAIKRAKEKYRKWLEEKGHWGLSPKVPKKYRRTSRRMARR